MLGDGKIFSCLHNLNKAVNLKVNVTKFNLVTLSIFLYLFNNKVYTHI
jgi:hypothetical protein